MINSIRRELSILLVIALVMEFVFSESIVFAYAETIDEELEQSVQMSTSNFR